MIALTSVPTRYSARESCPRCDSSKLNALHVLCSLLIFAPSVPLRLTGDAVLSLGACSSYVHEDVTVLNSSCGQIAAMVFAPQRQRKRNAGNSSVNLARVLHPSTCFDPSPSAGSTNRLRWIVHPHGKAKVKWDLMVAVLIVYSTVSVPFRIGFEAGAGVLGTIVDTVVDVGFMLDIILSFRTAFVDEVMHPDMCNILWHG